MKITEIYGILLFSIYFTSISQSSCLTPSNISSLNFTKSSYCLPIINWNISQSSLDQYATLDAQALNSYTAIYSTYYLDNKIDIDCLGMSKYFFCASAYPACTDASGDSSAVCSWICNLFQTRCSAASLVYDLICNADRVRDAECSYQISSFVLSSLLILVLLLFY